DWRKVQTPMKLERLVRDAGFGRGYQRELYAQAWALVYFLRTQHPPQFLTFIDLLRGPGASSDTDGEGTIPQPRSDRAFNAFQRAFGPDLHKLERNWQTFMAGVRTPLEQHAPASSPASKVSISDTKSDLIAERTVFRWN